MKKKFAGPKIVTNFNVMYGVDAGFVGAGHAIRGLAGDLLPWESPSAVEGTLASNGFLFIRVKGLVLGNDPEVPENMRLINPDATFRGVVSCLTESGDDIVEQNVFTKEFKADAKGNSVIVQKLTLPNPCTAPIVLISAGTRDAWFAAQGFEN
jgi:hypothetical protein